MTYMITTVWGGDHGGYEDLQTAREVRSSRVGMGSLWSYGGRRRARMERVFQLGAGEREWGEIQERRGASGPGLRQDEGLPDKGRRPSTVGTRGDHGLRRPSGTEKDACGGVVGQDVGMTTVDPGLETAQAVFGDAFEQVKQYVDILTNRGVEWGLLGPKEAPRVWERHVLNSAALSSLVPEGSRVVDVGSGAGLPGLPLAIQRPDLEITLLEPLLRRSNFLTQAVEELQLGDRVTVLRGRAEDCDEVFDVVTARAVAKLPTLIGWTKGLFLPDGQLLALKGVSAADEVRTAGKALKAANLDAEVLVVRSHPQAEVTHVVRVSKAH